MKSKEEIAKSIAEAMGEDVLNDAEMEATEGGGNVLSDCSGSSNNCKEGNCAAGCGQQSIVRPTDESQALS